MPKNNQRKRPILPLLGLGKISHKVQFQDSVRLDFCIVSVFFLIVTGLVCMLNFRIVSRGLHLGQKGFAGQFSWSGPTVTGGCKPVSCDGKRLNDKPGPECQCANGFAGEPLYQSRSERRVPQLGPPPSVSSDEGNFSGEPCMPAECPIPNSIGQGPDCRCGDKFVGEIRWQGIVPSGECLPAPCNVQHSNKKPGPECACAFGYEEVVPIMQVGGDWSGTCDPIPCEGEKSNHQDGPGCGCADGYNGTVQMVKKLFSESGSGPALSNFTVFKADSCTPAKCAVESTTGDGPECRCSDGYQGSITWVGHKAVGTCKPAHCSIENSNRKPGLDCRCLDGYTGSILADVLSHYSAICLHVRIAHQNVMKTAFFD